MNAYAILHSNTHDAYVYRLYQTGACSYKLQMSLGGRLVRHLSGSLRSILK